MRLRLVCINLKSSTARDLANVLTAKVKHKVWRGKKPKNGTINIFYGAEADKIKQYEYFKNQQLPALLFTTCKQTAKDWTTEKQTVFCRTLTKACDGKGIVIANTPEEVVNAPVYTLYKKKKREYRVHVFNHKVVSVLEKRQKVGWDGPKNPQIRNTVNGYVFCHEDVIEPEGIRELAVKASYATSSDFAGVDIGYNELKNELFVIEVNSAPGIAGSNLDRYSEVIIKEAYGN